MPDTDRRNHPRIKAKVKVRFKNASAFIAEYTHNISKGGLFVRTAKPCPMESLVEVIIVLPETEEEIHALGRVMHVVTQEEAEEDRPAGMGLELHDISPEDLAKIDRYISEKIKQGEVPDELGRRKHKRYQAKLRVRFGSLEALREEYTHNISHGGIFIKTRNPKRMGDRLRLILIHPQTGEELELEGEVVRVVDEKEAAATGQPLGMGVVFVNQEEEIQARLRSFIKPEYLENKEFDPE